MELESERERYEERGIRVAALSYDPVDLLRAFAERAGIGYPLLSDPESRWIREAGIFNDTISPDNPVYGMPFPGWILVDAAGNVTETIFHEAYADRTTSGALLVRRFGVDGAGAGEATTDHAGITWSASNAAIRFGQIVTLTVDVTPWAGLHVYAPGTEGYFAVEWDAGAREVEAATGAPAAAADHTASLIWGDVTWPPSRTLHLPAIGKEAPVYGSAFRLLRDVHLPNDKALRERLAGTEEMILRGTLTYQACDDEKCFLPVTVPLEWRLRLEEHDRTRVPEELRRGASGS